MYVLFFREGSVFPMNRRVILRSYVPLIANYSNNLKTKNKGGTVWANLTMLSMLSLSFGLLSVFSLHLSSLIFQRRTYLLFEPHGPFPWFQTPQTKWFRKQDINLGRSQKQLRAHWPECQYALLFDSLLHTTHEIHKTLLLLTP